MSKATRHRLLNEAPLRPPLVATKLWGIAAASVVVGFIPVTVGLFYLWSKLATWLQSHYAVHPDPPVFILVLIAVMVCFFIPAYVGFRAASLYCLRLMKYYLDHNETEQAEQVALTFSEKIWIRHAKNCPWFREFVATQGLKERVKRYSKLRV